VRVFHGGASPRSWRELPSRGCGLGTGWAVRSISCGNNSTFVVADAEVISWGPSPTYGELGFGDPAANPKSSTVPKIVDCLTVRSLTAIQQSHESLGISGGRSLTRPFRDARRFPSTRL
jgi:hypothetical protein